jgi:CRP/FNR family transcriptional regulator
MTTDLVAPTAGDAPIDRLALLRELPYLKVLDEPSLQIVAQSAMVRTHRAGDLLLIQGDPCPGLLVVQAGRVKTVLLSASGREHILNIHGPGEAVNEADAFNRAPASGDHSGRRAPSSATIQALDDATTLAIGHAGLAVLFEQLTPPAQATLLVLAERCRDLVGAIADLSLRPVTARLAGLLLDHAVRPDRPTLTRSQMAARLGTVREMVSRSLRDLERAGLIRIDRGQIVVVEQDGLARLAER